MTIIISTSRHKYNIFRKVNISDIDFGATPDRTNKAITLKCTTLESEIRKESVGGHSYEFIVPVSIDVYQRMREILGSRGEPHNLVEIEKSLVNHFAINRLSLRDDGVNNIKIRSVQTFLDAVHEEWYHLQMIVDMHYQMSRLLV